MPASRKKTRKSRSDSAVQGTNDSSIVSKLAMVQAGYFTDPFLQFMVEKRRARRSPLINRGYYIRAMAMDSLIKQFLDKFGPDCQIFSLGAGFDTTYFRLTSSGALSHVTSFTEVDFREVANRKARLIVSQSELWTLLSRDQPPPIGENGPEVVSSGNYRLLACDLSDVTLLETCWRHLAECHKPTLLLSECVLTYMNTKSSQAVISAAADYFSNAVFLTYEQIYPLDAFGRVMTSHFRRLGSPLRGIDTYPTPQLQEQRYLDAGWEESLCVPMTHVYCHVLSECERARVRGLEMFDEYEEWHLKAGHYLLVCSMRGGCRGLYQQLRGAREASCHSPQNPARSLTVHPVLRGLNGLARFGHDVSHCDVTLAEGDVSSAESTTCDSGLRKLTVSDDAVSKTDTSGSGGGVKTVKDDARTGDHDVSTPGGDVRTPGGDVRTSDVRTPGSDVRTPGSDVRTPGGDVRTSVDDARTTGSDVRTPGGDVRTSVDDVRTRGVLVTGGFGDVGSGKHSRDVGHVMLDVGRVRCTDVNVRGQNALDRRMFHSVSALSPTQILIFGGRTSPSQCFNDVITLNLQSAPAVQGISQSEAASVEAWFESVPVIGCKPCERYRHAAILVKNGDSSHLYVFGGMTGETRVLSDTWRYDVTRSSWKEMAPLPSPRCSARAAAWRCGEELVTDGAAWRGGVVLSGGLGVDERPLVDIDVYCSDRDEWRRLETDIQPRYSHTSHVLRDDLYLVGGVSLSYPQPAVTRINLLTGLVQDYTLPATPEPLMLHNHCSLLLTPDCDSQPQSSDTDAKNGDKTNESDINSDKNVESDSDSSEERTEFLILGGGGNCFSFGTHLNSPVVLTLR